MTARLFNASHDQRQRLPGDRAFAKDHPSPSARPTKTTALPCAR